MQYKNYIGLILLLVVFPASVFAGEDYKCQITRLSFASGDFGKNYEMHVKAYVGQEFTVERASGLMAGSLKNSYITTPKVIDLGSKDRSYKVSTTMRLKEGAGAGTNIYALNISEYIEGKSKPFIFMQNDVVYFGSCTHF